MSRLLNTQDINFIKTLLENNPKKIERIVVKRESKDSRILNIISLAEKNSTAITFDKTKRFEAYFYPREMEDINFLENNIFQHYNVWFISSIYIPYVMVHIHMYIGNGDLCPGVLYIASGPSSCRNRSQRIAALPVLIFYFEYSCSTLQ